MSLNHKKVQRKGSKTIWEVFDEDEDTIFIMSHSQYRPMSRMVKRKTFEKYWNIL